jgi:hypothetical protein
MPDQKLQKKSKKQGGYGKTRSSLTWKQQFTDVKQSLQLLFQSGIRYLL